MSLPRGWKRVRFTDAVKDVSAGNAKVPESKLQSAGAYAVVDQGQSLVAGFTDEADQLCRVELPAIVFGDHTRCFKFIDFPFCMGADGTKVLRPADGDDPKFLYHQLKHLRLPAAGYSRHFKFLKERELILPPLPEQQHIAAVLDGVTALQARRRAALAELDQLTEAVFLGMFGDPAANRRRWPTMELGDLLSTAEVFVDGDWVESKDQDPTGEVRLIQLADVGDGVYNSKSARFLTKSTALRLKCTFLRPGDLLIARMPDPLGRSCIYPGDEKEAVTVVDVCVVRPGNRGPDPTWLMTCINSRGFRSLIGRHATGTTRARISRGNLSRISIIVPPLSEQQEFACRAAAIERLKATQRASLAEMDALFASLQHRAFRGEL